MEPVDQFGVVWPPWHLVLEQVLLLELQVAPPLMASKPDDILTLVVPL